MKKLVVIAIIAVTACISAPAHARNGAGWDFLTKFFTGAGTNPDCTVINSDDPLKEATLVQSMKNSGDMTIGVNSNGISYGAISNVK